MRRHTHPCVRTRMWNAIHARLQQLGTLDTQIHEDNTSWAHCSRGAKLEEKLRQCAPRVGFPQGVTMGIATWGPKHPSAALRGARQERPRVAHKAPMSGTHGRHKASTSGTHGCPKASTSDTHGRPKASHGCPNGSMGVTHGRQKHP